VRALVLMRDCFVRQKQAKGFLRGKKFQYRNISTYHCGYRQRLTAASICRTCTMDLLKDFAGR
jgi:hypothetical protein